MKQAPFTSKRWRRVEYERLVEVGALEGEPIELIGGQLIVAEPKGSPHAACVDMTGDALWAALPPGWILRMQNPLALDDESSPEPDVAVVRGHHADYRHAHPVRAALIVEVAESSLPFDRASDCTVRLALLLGGALSSAGYPDATRAAPGNRSRRRAPAIADRPVSFPRLRRG